MSDVTEALWRDADWHAATQAEKEARLAAATAAGGSQADEDSRRISVVAP